MQCCIVLIVAIHNWLGMMRNVASFSRYKKDHKTDYKTADLQNMKGTGDLVDSGILWCMLFCIAATGSGRGGEDKSVKNGRKDLRATLRNY